MIPARPYRSLACNQLNQRVYRIANLRVTSSPTANTYVDGITASDKYIAVPWTSKGSVMPLPVNTSDYTVTDAPSVIFSAPGQDLTDLQFSPHAANVIAITSRDGTLRLFELPNDYKELSGNITVPSVELVAAEGLEQPQCLAWHPTVRGLVAVGTKNGVLIVNLDYAGFGSGQMSTVTQQAKVIGFVQTGPEGLGKEIVRVTWNVAGTHISAVGRDGGLYICDPRKSFGSDPQTSLAPLLEDLKNPICSFFIGEQKDWTSNTLYVLVVGLGPQRRAFYRVISYSKDTNSAACLAQSELAIRTGQLLAHYDTDSQLLTVTARGSQTAVVYDTFHVSQPKPNTNLFTAFLSYQVPSCTKGLAFLPKRLVDVMATEINQFVSHTGTSVEVFSYNALRKDKGFHKDLFPDTHPGVANNTVDAYTSGKDVLPAFKSLSPH